MRLIGITGTIGAGKGTVAEYLESKGFAHYSAREVISDEIRRRGLPVNRDTLREVANDMRSAHGPDRVFEELWARAQAGGTDAVIESVRTVEGTRLLKERGATLLAIDADPRVRYGRVKERGTETDQISFETFVEHERKEMAGAAAHELNLAACIAMADWKIMNDGSVEELHSRIDEFLSYLPSA